MPSYLFKWMKNNSRRKNPGVMEHSDLVEEMWRGEWMSTGERLSLARRRRQAQLRTWTQREQEIARLPPQPPTKPSIRFTDSVVLLEAASRNDIDEVRKLLMKGVSPDSTNEDGLTALHQCCIDDNEDMMRLLLEFGANVNAEDSERWTPLHAAATCGHLHLVRHLIDNGAELLAVNSDGNMPYDICEDESSLEAIEGEMARRGVTQQLIDETRQQTESNMLDDLKQIASKGGDLESRDHQAATPLHIAAANGYTRVVEFLLDHHVSTDVKDVDNWQPLHAAACWGHVEVVEMLVQQGADLNARTRLDETPLDMAEDPELRQRIEDLWREQERRKERRSVSCRANSNTRVRSVRRTSVRDKGLTAKLDAAIEAKSLRLIQSNDVSLKDRGVREGEDRKEPEGKDSDSLVPHDSPLSANTTSASLEVPAEASYSEESNGKINIHVSVTINAGTLAELKRARAMSRVASPDNGSGSITSSSSLQTTDSPRKFIGTTSETMVGDAKATRCCSIL